MKKNVVLRAPVLSQSGYGVHSRQIARWLLSRDDIDLTVHPVQWGITPWILDKDAHDGLIGQLLARSTAEKTNFDVSIQVQLPNEWSPTLARKNIGVTAGVETTICNPLWVDCVNKMTRVIVPSTFVKSIFEKSSVVNPVETDGSPRISVIPESFIDAISTPSDIFDFDTKFNFLFIGQLTSTSIENDRKNIFKMLKLFCEAFSENKDVGLIIKTNSGRDTQIDFKITKDAIKNAIAAFRKGPYPKIHFIHGSLHDNDVAGLYANKSVKAFVSCTRGEGFGLPLLEAAAAGLPVIATDWSGHLDFLSCGKFIKLDFELKQIPKLRVDNAIFMPDAKWADPFDDDIKRKLIKFYEKPTIPTTWALELKEKIHKKYSFKAVSSLYDAFWDQI